MGLALEVTVLLGFDFDRCKWLLQSTLVDPLRAMPEFLALVQRIAPPVCWYEHVYVLGNFFIGTRPAQCKMNYLLCEDSRPPHCSRP